MNYDTLPCDHRQVMAKANGKKSSKETPTLGQEILAVLGVFFAIFLLLSLVSFYLPGQEGGELYQGNWCGKIGGFTATLLSNMFGISSFWFVIFFSFFSWQFFFVKFDLHRLPYILLGCTGILISNSALTAPSLFNSSCPSVHSVGCFLQRVTQPYLGTSGFVLVYLFLFIISLMVALRFSPYFVGSQLVKGIDRLWKLFRNRMIKKDDEEHGQEVKSTKKVLTVDAVTEERPAIPITPKLHEPPALTAESPEDFQPVPVDDTEFRLPSIKLLDKPKQQEETEVDKEHFMEVSRKLESKLNDFGVKGNVVGISPGPVVTTYEFAPAPGVKISKVVSLEDDLALGLRTESVRIVGSVPGKAALGIEIPNPIRQDVYIRDILASEKFQKIKAPLTLGLGKDVIGNIMLANLAEMPHLLIAGATGAGKSVGINTIICSMLLKATPDQVRLLMVDPKRIELSAYEHIPHLLHPVVVDPKMASRALQWAVLEMERRYGLMEELRVKNIAGYNQVAEEKLPLIVIIIDELADLMMVASKDVESSVARLAQMARAAGMHLILATQRPSVDVLTGLIKANFPTRMSFKVSSKIDSRTILDTGGAEHLLGRGDMLLVPPGSSRLQRIHGAYISEAEIERIVNFLKEQRTATYDESVLKIEEEPDQNGGVDEEEYDEKYDEAVAFVCETGMASISSVQRRLRVGYNRAARMIEIMEREGIVGPADGVKPREVLVRKEY